MKKQGVFVDGAPPFYKLLHAFPGKPLDPQCLTDIGQIARKFASFFVKHVSQNPGIYAPLTAPFSIRFAIFYPRNISQHFPFNSLLPACSFLMDARVFPPLRADAYASTLHPPPLSPCGIYPALGVARFSADTYKKAILSLRRERLFCAQRKRGTIAALYFNVM